jgi:hypothetical protein
MPVTLNNFSDGTLCAGYSWTINDITELADKVGRVAVGQSHHVARILAGVNVGPPATTANARSAAIQLLTVPVGSDPWHRDGWLFQTISWLAANRANPTAVIRAPHMILAHKGFDGLQLDIDASSGLVSAAVIFEDKATDNPRQTIRQEVWPEFKLLEAGDRENVLSADVSALLQTQPGIDHDKAIESVIWKKIRHYRLSITVGADHVTPIGRKKLFKGYDKIAAGSVDRRRGEILYIEHLRPWMAALADQAISLLNSSAVPHV